MSPRSIQALEAWHDEFDLAVIEDDIDNAVSRADNAAYVRIGVGVLELCNAPGNVIPVMAGIYGSDVVASLIERGMRTSYWHRRLT